MFEYHVKSWPLQKMYGLLSVNFSSFLKWLKPKIWLKTLSPKSCWLLHSCWDLGKKLIMDLFFIGTPEESSSRSFIMKTETCNARQKPKWQIHDICWIFLYMEAGTFDRINHTKFLLSFQEKCPLPKQSLVSPMSLPFGSQSVAPLSC